MTTIKVRARLMLWSNAIQYDIWPQFLAQARGYISREFSLNEAKARIGHLPIARGGHRVGQQMLTDMQGFRIQGSDLAIIEGVKLLEYVDPSDSSDGALQRICDDGLQLAELYQTDSHGQGWRTYFAQHLLRYELRTRVLVKALCVPGQGLCFPHSGAFSDQINSLSHANLVTLDGREVQLFSDVPKGTMQPLGQAMCEQVEWVVGPSWRKTLTSVGLTLSAPWSLTTIRGGPITNLDIASRLKPVLKLIWDLHLLTRDPESALWSIDRQAFAATFLDEDIQRDFLDYTQDSYLTTAVAGLYRAVLGPTGYAKTHDLALALTTKLERSEWEADRLLDQVIGELTYRGHVRVTGNHAGFPKDGPGLHGQYNYQYIQLDFGRVDG